jgi:hypothetical protein
MNAKKDLLNYYKDKMTVNDKLLKVYNDFLKFINYHELKDDPDNKFNYRYVNAPKSIHDINGANVVSKLSLAFYMSYDNEFIEYVNSNDKRLKALYDAMEE